MSERNIDVVISAKDEYTASLLKGTDGPGASLLKLIESFKAVSSAANEAAEVFARMDSQLKGVEIGAAASAEKAASAVKEHLGLFDFIGKAFEEHQKTFGVLTGMPEIYAASVKSLEAVHTSAYGAMEGQILNYLETERFATEEFGKIIVQQVKMELVGVSAKAAVQALYFSALGFAALTPWGAATLGPPMLFFTAAGQMAAVSGAAFGGALAVHSVVQGNDRREYAPPASSTAGGSPARSLKSPSASLATPLADYATASKVQPVQNITIQIYNPLSEQNWTKIAEENIIPAINDAVNRNVVLTVK